MGLVRVAGAQSTDRPQRTAAWTREAVGRHRSLGRGRFRALQELYRLPAEAIAFYRDAGSVRLPGVLPAAVVAALAARCDRLLHAAYGAANPGRFLAQEQVWRHDPLLRSAALSPRLGDIAARLLGVGAVRLYHDNILSKEPGCGRTPWHRNADHYPLASAVCTSWIPLHDIPSELGPLACLARGAEPHTLASARVSAASSQYDELVEAELRRVGVAPDAGPFTLGEVSFHSTDCLHTAGPNLTTSPRRVLSSTYYADGTRVVDEPTELGGRWTDFLPGVEPGASAVSPLNPAVGSS